MNTKTFLMKYTKKQSWRLVMLFVCTICYALLSLATPLVFSFFIDNVINLKPITNSFLQFIADVFGGVETLRSNLWLGALIIVIVNAVLCFFVFFRGRLNGVISENITYDIRNDLYTHLQVLPYSYHVKAKTGDLIQRCTTDVDIIRRVFAAQLSQMIYSIFIAIFAITILVSINLKMALIAVISMPFLIGYAYVFFINTQKTFLASDEAEGALTASVQENLSGIRVVKAFNKEAYEIEKFEKKNKEFKDLTFKVIKLLGKYWSSSDFICLLQIFIVAMVGIFEARAGNITVGDFFVFISYESMIIYPIRNLGRILADVGKMGVSIKRLTEILNEKEEDLESGETPEIKGDIVFDDVSFKYDDGTRNTISNVSFKLEKGKMLAILGPTGSGKSSLVHLLSRLYDPTQGHIYIDGTDITKIQKKYLRKKIGIVLQEPFLYSKSIYENINLGNYSANEENVKRAAMIASVHDVIEGFDQGYNTLVGEKGVTLSGGQKQRIAIARTIINQTPILIFDDSLSAVDTETDESIRHALRSIQKDVSMIIITQRVSSAKEADEIIVLEKGKITQIGTHETLIHTEGLYKRIDAIQSQMIYGGDE